MLLKTITATLLAGSILGGVVAPAEARSRPLPTWKAKQVARNRAWDLDYRVETVKVDWFVRWARYRVDVGVTGAWTRDIYHSGCADGYYPGCSSDSWTETVDSDCSATVVVRKSRQTGHVRSRITDKSCFYG